MLQRLNIGTWGVAPPPLFLQRIAAYRFRGWGSAKALRGKDLEEREG